MFDKRMLAFSALNLALASASAQSILDKVASKPSAAQSILDKVAAKPATAASPPVTAQNPVPAAGVVPAAKATPASVKPAALQSVPPQAIPATSSVTIRELAEKQASAIAADANRKLAAAAPAPVLGNAGHVVGELRPVEPIPVTMSQEVPQAKPPKPAPPPRPYFAALIGLKGQEIAEIQLGGGRSFPLRVGGSVANWTLKQIVDGHLVLVATEAPKAKPSKSMRKTAEKQKVVVKERVLSVGDFL